MDALRTELATRITTEIHTAACDLTAPGAADRHDEIATRAARWTANGGDYLRIYRPAADRCERVAEVIEPTFAAALPPMLAGPRDPARPELGRNLADDAPEQASRAAEQAITALDTAGLLIPENPTPSPARDELIRLIAHARSRSTLRDGTMGGGYYSAYIGDEEIADMILNADTLTISQP